MNTDINYGKLYSDYINNGTGVRITPQSELFSNPLMQPEADSFVSSAAKDGKDDGKISFGEKLKNFGKGLISPVTNLLSSPKNFLIGTVMIAGGAALLAITGGAAAPIMVALGVTAGAVQLGTGIYKAANAKTDAEAEAAWQGMGAGTTSVGLSVLGSKSALKGAKIKPQGGFIKSTVQCFKEAPAAFGKSFANAKAFFGINGAKANSTSKTKEPAKAEEPAKKAESKPEPEPAAKPKTDTTSESPPEATSTTKPEHQKPASITKKDGTRIELEYNDNGTIKQSTLVDSDGVKTVKSYNENGKFQRSVKVEQTDEGLVNYVTEHTRNANGKITTRKTVVELDGKQAYDIETTYSYDSQGKHTGRITRSTSADGVDTLHYDAKGAVVKHESISQPNPTEPVARATEQPEAKVISGKREIEQHHDIQGLNGGIRKASTMQNNGQALDSNQIELLRSVDDAFESLTPLDKDHIFYRGMSEQVMPCMKKFNKALEVFDSARVGDIIIPDSGCAYTACSKKMASNWAKGLVYDGSVGRRVMLKIRAPKGAKISCNLEHGGEGLFPRNAQYRVLSKTEANGLLEAVLEYIIPKS